MVSFISFLMSLFIAINQAEGSAIIPKVSPSKHSCNLVLSAEKEGINDKEKSPAMSMMNPAERATHPTTSRRGIRKNAPVRYTP